MSVLKAIETIDAAKAIELLEAAVAVRGADYVYGPSGIACSYVRNGEPSCLVGLALSLHGVPLDTLEWWDRLSECTVNELCKSDALPFVTDDAAHMLHTAQGTQDSGYTWGAALEAARKAVSE